ncbi:MAG: rhodanese-related sulfurtransferase [Gammaproteobacteria bacterium]|nr:rhodanese-related sulfurtransferase [Gammaproteobacteria bacterium]
MNCSAIVIAALYKFVTLDDCHVWRERLHAACAQLQLKGTLLLAREGINGTVAGSRAGIDALLALLRADPRLADLEHKESLAATAPFARMKVRVKHEIVTLGAPAADPTRQVGEYVDPAEWNALIADPDVLVLDTRNDYEHAIGSFHAAVDPGIQSFQEFPAYIYRHLGGQRQRRIATFCTGGIRCEKATAFLLGQGFDQVYHLKGGILKYLEQIPPEASLWRGECFVFDARVSVGHGLVPGSATLCRACGWAVTAEERDSSFYRADVYCPHCHPQADARTTA